MKITTVGFDLAKNVFQVHGADAHGKAVLRKQLKRKDVRAFFANRLAWTKWRSPTRWRRSPRCSS